MADIERDTPTPKPIPPIPEPPRLRSASLPDLDDEPAHWKPSSGMQGESSNSNSGNEPLPGWVITEPQGDLTPTTLFEGPSLQYSDENQPPDDGRPLISPLQPMSVLRQEYENGNQVFIQQIDWLQSQGYIGLRRAKGDGDCFYRALAFAYISYLLHSPDPDLSVTTALALLESHLEMFKHENVGFHEIVYEDFHETLATLIKSIVQPAPGMPQLTPEGLLEAFNHAETSNSIVIYLRLLTSAQIRIHPEDYEAFLFNPETGDMMTPVEFCNSFVEPANKEADEVQIRALTRVLHINLEVAYLDGRVPSNSQSSQDAPDSGLVKVEFVKFETDEDDDGFGALMGDAPVRLLYRPGHYDILDNKSSLPGEQLHMSAIPSISITRSGSSEAGQSTVSGSVGAATW